MTIKELSELYHINNKIERLQNTIDITRNKTLHITSSISDMPSGGVKTDYMVELVYYSQMLEEILIASIIEKQRLESYINSIDDTFIQNIIAYRFINLLNWNEVANLVGGTENSVKQMVHRFIKKN